MPQVSLSTLILCLVLLYTIEHGLRLRDRDLATSTTRDIVFKLIDECYAEVGSTAPLHKMPLVRFIRERARAKAAELRKQ